MREHIFLLIAIGVWFLGSVGSGQTVELAGPGSMGLCETATFTVTLVNTTAQTLSQILITETRPNPDFVYVAGSSNISLHDGSTVAGEPVESGLDLVWDLDSILGSPYELPPGGTLTIQFDLATNCNAISGTHTTTAQGTGFTNSPSDSLSVEILPGAVEIRKEPSVIEAHVGDTVTWTITVESTGLGPIHNVVVTDSLGSGLSYVLANPEPDSVSGGEIVWNLGMIQAGESKEIQLQVQVVACEGLENRADARFGCDDGSVCYDTAVDGGTAVASIDLIVDNPLLDFTPPDIQFPYCEPSGTTVTMAVTNTGDGPAKNVRICVDFPPDLQVQNVQDPATWDGSCFHLPDLAAGESTDLAFDVVYTGDWCEEVPSGSLYWLTVYNNVCGEEFRPPAALGTYGTDYGPEGPPTLSVSLDGPNQVLICAEYDYSLSVDFSGHLSCGNGSTSGITVQVDVPEGFTVVDPGGGTWTPGGDGTGGTITWTGVDPTIGLSTTFTLYTPGSSRCGQVFPLTATATATDCCGCELSGSDSLSIAVECRDLVDTVRTASPATQEKCGTITYTTTYSFVDDPALDDVSFDELTFIDHAENGQDYVEDSLAITIDGTPVDPLAVVDNTPGGTFEIQGIDDTSSVRGKTLVISYQMAFSEDSEPTSCSGSHTFYSWAELQLGPDCQTGDECTDYCSKSEATPVTTATPSMSVTIEGLPDDFVDPCGTYDITLTLTKTSDFDPYNVKLQLENINYCIVDLSAITCSGICPSNLNDPTETATYYEWDYGDAFVGEPNGAQSVLELQVRKRCGPGAELTATALFGDSCGYSACSVSASDAPAYMREPLLYVYKTPEVIYATENKVTWSIYVTNGGAGPAHEVWVDDILGDSLEYVSSDVDPDVTVTPGEDHTGAPINGATFHIPEIAPGATKEITITARMISCDTSGLTDTVQAGQFCGGEECVTPDEDTASIEVPDTVVVATSYLESPMALCAETFADITVRNAGDPTIYHLVDRMVLPSGIEYVLGSTEWQVDGGPWNPGGDPTVTGDINTGYILEWDENAVSGLASLGGGSTIVVRLKLRPLCSFDGGYFEAYVDYETVCAEQGTIDVGLFYVEAAKPEISVSKQQVNPPAGSPIDCGSQITWRIDATNTGDATADYVWVEDTLGDGFTYVSSQGDGTYAVDDGYNSGQLVTWALEDLPPGATATLYLTAQENGTCGDLSNTVKAWWGCGDDLDGSSATNDATCLTDTSAEDSTTATRTPEVALSYSLEPTQIPACGQATFALTIQNTSTATARAIDVRIALPSGLSYVPGSTEIDCGAGFSGAPDPTVSGQTLTWYDESDTGSNLCDSIPPGGEIRLRFGVQASCYVNAGDADVTVWFYDCCLESQEESSTTYAILNALPALSITKEPDSVALDCHDPSDTVTWTITVNNTGDATADWVRIEDTLGDSLVYVSSNPPATDLGGNTYVWELGPLAPGESTSVQITAYLQRPPDDCSDNLRTNTARATWGCGTPDGDPTTPEECGSGLWVQDTALVTIPDLSIAPSDIVPQFTCYSDGNYSGSVQLTIHNRGDAPVTEDFQITLSEAHTGWSVSGYFSADFGGTLPIDPGSSRTITIPGWPVTCGICDYEFAVELDTADEICECNEGNNSNSRTWTITIPDLRVDSSDLAISCAGDGVILISGTITVANDGCGEDFTGDIPVRFTLYGGSGCTGDVLHQWDETLPGVDIPAGGTQTFDISHEVATDICQASGCIASLHVSLDPDEEICECDGMNNDHCAALPVDIPDLVVVGEDLSLSCAGDGEIEISGTITLGNQGCGDLSASVPVRFTLYGGPGCSGDVLHQWTETFGVDIPAGGEETIAITPETFALDACIASENCTVSLRIEADYADQICECDGTNDDHCVDKVVEIPDLAIVSVEPDVPDACSPGAVAVTVENVGCAESSAGVPVRITGDATGEASLPALAPGESIQVIVHLNEVLPCGTYTITATVDPDDSVCECSSANNAREAAFDVVDPDLAVVDLSVSCNGDDTFDLSAEVRNLGTEGSPPSELRIYIDGGLAHTETVPALAVGESYGISFTSPPLKCGEAHQFRVVVDEGDSICECDETDNEMTTTAGCPCPALVTDKEILEVRRGASVLPPDAVIEPGDVILYELRVTNVGGGKAFDVDVSDKLPVEFLYVTGSTDATWPGGSYSTDPDGAPGPDLSWDTSAELGPDETLVLRFRALVTSAVVPGQSYTDTMHATGTEGDGTPIPSDNSSLVPEDDDPDDSDSVTHIAAIPGLSVDKEIVDVIRNGVSIWPTDRVEPGDLIHYRFTIRNVGEGTAYDVDFTDELPPGLEYDTDYADGTYTVDSPPQAGSLGIPDGATGHLVADISATLNGGGTLVGDFYAYVTSAVQQGVDLENYATATGVDGYGTPIPPENPQIGDTSDDDPDDLDPDDTGLAGIEVGEPGLALDKEIADVIRNGQSIGIPPVVLWEDVIVYRVTISNVGLGTAYDVDFQDVLPPGTEYDIDYGDGTYAVDSPPQSGTLGIPDGATGTIYADIYVQLDPGATLIIEYRVRVTPDAVPGSWLENHALVTGRDGAGTHIPKFNDDVGDSFPDDDFVGIRLGAAALVTEKVVFCEACLCKPDRCDPCATEPVPVRVGEEVTFRLTVKNVGYSAAYDIVVEDVLPPGFEYVPKSARIVWPGGDLKMEPFGSPGPHLTWVTGAALEAGETLTITFKAVVTSTAILDKVVKNLMTASAVDDFSQPIPADASEFVPADTDPDDASVLHLIVRPEVEDGGS